LSPTEIGYRKGTKPRCEVLSQGFHSWARQGSGE
jgi:hypothetical protein